jgi:iron complex transport system permease protein
MSTAACRASASGSGERGACIVTIADAIARAALPPAEIPLGLITAVAGGPFFILLLAHRLRT